MFKIFSRPYVYLLTKYIKYNVWRLAVRYDIYIYIYIYVVRHLRVNLDPNIYLLSHPRPPYLATVVIWTPIFSLCLSLGPLIYPLSYPGPTMFTLMFQVHIGNIRGFRPFGMLHSVGLLLTFRDNISVSN
jgi:hypothetical protein